MMQTKVAVDIVSGASAGGLNGVLLSQALAHSLSVSDIDGIRDVWLEDGAMTSLLRSPFETDPPSLLRGDTYFLPQIQSVLQGWAQHPDPMWQHSHKSPFDLIVTATLLAPAMRTFRDDLDQVIVEDDHHGRFRFTKEHFASDAVVPALARAARTSASFPGAFEASYCGAEFDQFGPALPDVRNFEGGKFAIDGGVLANLPVHPAVELLYGRSSDRDIRRVLAYVSPDSGGTAPPPAPAASQDAVKPPSPTLADVLIATLMLPSKQSIAQDLADLQANNSRITDQIGRRAALLSLTSPATYLDVARHGVPGVPERTGAPLGRAHDGRGRQAVAAHDRPDRSVTLEAARERARPRAIQSVAGPLPGCRSGTHGRGRARSVALGDRPARLFGVGRARHRPAGLPLAPLADTDVLAELGRLRKEIHEVRHYVKAVRDLDDQYWAGRFDRFDAAASASAANGKGPKVVASGDRLEIDWPPDADADAGTPAPGPVRTWADDAYTQWPGALAARRSGRPSCARRARHVGHSSAAASDSGWQATVQDLLEGIAFKLAEVLLDHFETLRDISPSRVGDTGRAPSG